MTTIRIRKTIDSETLRLPELRPFIGQTVDIVIGESTPAGTGITPGQGDWDTVLTASRQLVDYDDQAQIDQDACDLRDMEEMQERMK